MNQHAEIIEPDGPGLPRIRVFRSRFSTPSMAVSLQFNTGGAAFDVWLSVRQARELAATVLDFGDAVEAMLAEDAVGDAA